MARKPSLKDVVRLGMQVATVKANTDPKKWDAIVKAAHARGVTVGGALSGQPPELQSRLHSSLKRQAENATKASYAPAYKDLATQATSANALSDKRATDNAAYREWLVSQTGRLQADARAADAALESRLHTIQDDTQNAWRDTATQAHENAQNMAGTVSDTSQSKALNSLGAAAANSNEHMAASRTAAVEQSGHAVADMNVAGAALLAGQGVNEFHRQDDLNKALAKIAADRAGLKLHQADDTTKGYNDLLANEATKAQTAQETAIAADKLGVEQDKLDYTKIKDNRDYGLAKDKLSLAELVAQNTKVAADAKVALGYDALSQRDGKAAADRALKKWIVKYNADHAKKPSGKPSPTAIHDSQNLYRAANTIKGQIIDLHRKPPKHSSIRAVLRSRGYDDTMIDIAEDLRVHNGKLSPAGQAKARNAGILHPEKLWPTA